MKGKLRQAVGDVKSTVRDVRDDMREQADRRWRNRQAQPGQDKEERSTSSR
jgi:uncharacterized protein YjbJ (UPF0337 family)